MGYPEPGCSFALPWCITNESCGQTMWVRRFGLSRCKGGVARATRATELDDADAVRKAHQVRVASSSWDRVHELHESLFVIHTLSQKRPTPHGAFRREVSALPYATNRRVHACEVAMRSANINDREPRGKASPHRAESAGELCAYAGASSKTHDRALRHGGVRCR